MNPATQATISSLEQSDVAEVAEQFVLCYYKMMNDSPDQLHRFYQANSSMIYEDAPVFGQKCIHDKFMQLSLRNNCGVKVHVLQLDALKAYDKIVIQVAGEISADKCEWRRFMQTFVLGEISANNFFVMTDIFRFQDRVFGDLALKEHAPVEAISKPVVEPPTKVAVEKPASATTIHSKETPTKSNPKQSTPAVHQNGFEHPQPHADPAVAAVAKANSVPEALPPTPVKETPPEQQTPKSWAEMAVASNGTHTRPRAPVEPVAPHVVSQDQNNENHQQSAHRGNDRPGRGGGPRHGGRGGGGGGAYSDREHHEGRRGGGGGPRNTTRGGGITVGGGRRN